MFRVLALALWLATLLAGPAAAQTSSLGTGIVGTNAVQTCGPVTGTLAAVGDAVTMPAGCNGFGTLIITVTTASGDSAFVGTFASRDAVTGGPRRLHKTGVGALQVSTETLSGTQGALEYRTCGGAGPQTITATAATSGRATVTIYGMLATTACFVNGSVQNAEEAALRAGKAFSASTGNQVVTTGNYLSLLVSNPANSGVRLVIPASNRIVGCDNVSSAMLPKYSSLVNATTNLPTTAATVTRRGGTTGTSAATALIANAASKPDTSPTTANPIGLPFFGAYAVPQDRTLEPGNSTLIYILGVTVPAGLGSANSTCSIIISWFEESLN